MATLPDTSRMACPVDEHEPWTAELELMTQVLEMVGLLAADRRLKKPVPAHRPEWVTRRPAPKLTDPEEVSVDTEGTIRGHLAVAAKAAAHNHLRVVD